MLIFAKIYRQCLIFHLIFEGACNFHRPFCLAPILFNATLSFATLSLIVSATGKIKLKRSRSQNLITGGYILFFFINYLKLYLKENRKLTELLLNSQLSIVFFGWYIMVMLNIDLISRVEAWMSLAANFIGRRAWAFLTCATRKSSVANRLGWTFVFVLTWNNLARKYHYTNTKITICLKSLRACLHGAGGALGRWRSMWRVTPPIM